MFYSGLFTVGMGFLAVLIGLYFLRRAVGLWRHGVPVQATVVGHDEAGETAVVEFRDLFGGKQRIQLREGGCPPLGHRIPVLYDRHHPARATAGPLSSLWKGSAIFIGLGLLFVAIGIGTWAGVVKWD